MTVSNNYNTTWQNVAGPNLSGMESLAAFIKAAGQSGKDLIGDVQKAREQGAAGAMIQEAMKYQDPAALQQAMASGALTQGIDSRYITPALMKQMDERVAAGQTAQHNASLIDLSKTRLDQANQELAFRKAEFGQEQQHKSALIGLDKARLDYFKEKTAQELADKRKTELDNRMNFQLQSAIETGDPAQLTALRSDPNYESWRQTLGAAGAKQPREAEAAAFAPYLQRTLAEIGNNSNLAARADALTELESTPYAANPLIRGQILAGRKALGVDKNNPEALVAVADARAANAPAAIATAVRTTDFPSRGSEWAAARGLTRNESGGKSNAENDAVGAGGKVGHFGLLQFGEARLTDGKNAGIIPKDMTPQQFRDSSVDFQNRVADWHFDDIDKKAAEAGLEKQYGRVINGVTISRDSIRAMAHLGGIEGVQRFISTNGEYDKADHNKTKISDYGKKFGGNAPAPKTLNPMKPTATDLAKNPNWQSEEEKTVFANNATSLLTQAAPKPDYRNMSDIDLTRASLVNNAQQRDQNLVSATQLRATQLAKYDVSHGADLRATYKDFVKSSESDVIKRMSYDEFAKLYKEYGVTKDKSGKEISKIPAARFVGALENSLARGKYSTDGQTDSILDSWDGFKGLFGLNEDFSMVDKYELKQNVKEFSKNVPALADIANRVKEGTLEERIVASVKVIAARKKLKDAEKAYSENSNQEGNLRIAEKALEKAYEDFEKIAPIMTY